MSEIFGKTSSSETPSYFNREITADELRQLLQEGLDALSKRPIDDENHTNKEVQAVYQRVLDDNNKFAFYLKEWNRLNLTDSDWGSYYQIDGD